MNFNLPLQFISFVLTRGLFPPLEADSDSDTNTDSCTMQDFSTGLNLDYDPLIEMHVIRMEIFPWDGDPSDP